MLVPRSYASLIVRRSPQRGEARDGADLLLGRLDRRGARPAEPTHSAGSTGRVRHPNPTSWVYPHQTGRLKPESPPLIGGFPPPGSRFTNRPGALLPRGTTTPIASGKPVLRRLLKWGIPLARIYPYHERQAVASRRSGPRPSPTADVSSPSRPIWRKLVKPGHGDGRGSRTRQTIRFGDRRGSRSGRSQARACRFLKGKGTIHPFTRSTGS